MAFPVVYRSIDTTLNVLTNYKVDSNTQALLEIYYKALAKCKEDEVANPNAKKHPLIVLEGLDGCGKSTVTKVLAAKLKAAKWCTPPDSIKHLRHLFDNYMQLRTAYYSIGNYIAALECALILKKQPVVMDRFWHSTAAYSISQGVYDFPDKIEIPIQGDNFYQWPPDLLKPDAVIFLEVDESTRIQRLSKRTITTPQETLLRNSQEFRDNVLLVYKNMFNPEVTYVEGNSTVKNVVNSVYEKVSHLFKK